MESEEKNEIKESQSKVESKLFTVFREKFEQEKELETKLEKALEFMREVLSDLDHGTLKDFWDAKKLIAPLFKEKINTFFRPLHSSTRIFQKSFGLCFL